MSSAPACLATIGEPASRSYRRLAAAAAWPRCGRKALEVGREHPVGAQQRLDAHRRGQVRVLEQRREVVAGQHQRPEHPVGAVDQRQPLLLGQHDRLDPGGAQGVGGGPELLLPSRSRTMPSPISGQRGVRQRGEVAGAAQAAVLVNETGA